VNLFRGSAERAIAALAQDDIAAEPGPLSPTALLVTHNSRRIQASAAYADGLVELQDAASQAVVDTLLPFAKGATVLDYCAGGGGKALHLASGGAGRIVAHDSEARRMRDIPARAKRAGLHIEITDRPHGTFDCVLIDVPCSGSGAWRRQPEAKWRLTRERLADLCASQDAILDEAVAHVRPGGILAYATCSLLNVENQERIAGFLERNADWEAVEQRRFTPLDGGDGFFVSILREKV
jgi:16S rRNA (cytosine967-C5)-methyltransferase